MKPWIRSTLGIVLVLFGTLWFLQGINVLPGTFMRGSTLWTVIGVVVLLTGLGVLSFRRRPGA